MRQLKIDTIVWPVKGVFRISRSALTEIAVLQVTITDGDVVGRGECRPYARYNETCESVTAEIEAVRGDIEKGCTAAQLQSLLSAGAARNAVDCALWDLQCKKENKRIWEILGIPAPKPRVTAFTLSVDTPENMAAAAIKAAGFPLLKMKVSGETSLKCVSAVLAARPEAKLIIDANEALSPEAVSEFQKQLPPENAVLIEQPLPAHTNERFNPDNLPPICADESLHTRTDLDTLWAQGYRAVNVKLDKCGGLTEGLALMQAAREKGFVIMAGCMVSSSLAMAPMLCLESFADVIDLDGPLLLNSDVDHALKYENAHIYPPTSDLWG